MHCLRLACADSAAALQSTCTCQAVAAERGLSPVLSPEGLQATYSCGIGWPRRSQLRQAHASWRTLSPSQQQRLLHVLQHPWLWQQRPGDAAGQAGAVGGPSHPCPRSCPCLAPD